MMRSRKIPLLGLAIAAGLLLSGALYTQEADACGGFFSRRATSNVRKPSLAYEQVLLVHDSKTELQHFVREVAFREAAEPFGFVVPTPSRSRRAPSSRCVRVFRSPASCRRWAPAEVGWEGAPARAAA
jgi:hypothetical protein